MSAKRARDADLESYPTSAALALLRARFRLRVRRDLHNYFVNMEGVVPIQLTTDRPGPIDRSDFYWKLRVLVVPMVLFWMGLAHAAFGLAFCGMLVFGGSPGGMEAGETCRHALHAYKDVGLFIFMGAFGHLHAAFAYRKRILECEATAGRNPFAMGRSFARVAIADAPRDGVSVAAVEGRVARDWGSEAALVGPLSNTPCVYHRVVIEIRAPGVPTAEPAYARGVVVSSDAYFCRFVVTDGTGVVFIDPVGAARSGASVEVDPVFSGRRSSAKVMDGFRVATVLEYESKSGVDGLPAPARAYVEASDERLAKLKDQEFIRVSEMLVREGDVVTVIGRFHPEADGEGSYRSPEAPPSEVALALLPDSVVLPARIADLRWLLAIRRVIFAMLIGWAVVWFVSVGAGLGNYAMCEAARPLPWDLDHPAGERR